MCSEQIEGMYISDIILLLLKSSLSDLLNENICLNIAEQQSIASKINKMLGWLKNQT